MTGLVILNIVLAGMVVIAMVGGLAWSILSDQSTPTRVRRVRPVAQRRSEPQARRNLDPVVS